MFDYHAMHFFVVLFAILPFAINACEDLKESIAYVGQKFHFVFPKTSFHSKSHSFRARNGSDTTLPTWLDFNYSTLTFTGVPHTPGTVLIVVTQNNAPNNSAQSCFFSIRTKRNPLFEAAVSTTLTKSQINQLSLNPDCAGRYPEYVAINVRTTSRPSYVLETISNALEIPISMLYFTRILSLNGYRPLCSTLAPNTFSDDQSNEVHVLWISSSCSGECSEVTHLLSDLPGIQVLSLTHYKRDTYSAVGFDLSTGSGFAPSTVPVYKPPLTYKSEQVGNQGGNCHTIANKMGTKNSFRLVCVFCEGEIFRWKLPSIFSKHSYLVDDQHHNLSDWSWIYIRKGELISQPMGEHASQHRLFIKTNDFSYIPCEVIVIPNKHPPNHKFNFYLNISYVDFEKSPSMRLDVISKIAKFFGDDHLGWITVDSYREYYAPWTPLKIIILNISNSSVGYECPEEKFDLVNSLYDKLVKNGKPSERLLRILQQYNVINVTRTYFDKCLERKVAIAADAISSSLWHQIGWPIAGVLICLMLLALIVAVVYRRKKCGSQKARGTTSGVKKRGVPIIFADELDECSGPTGTSPLILRNEKGPAPPAVRTPVHSLSSLNHAQPYLSAPPASVFRSSASLQSRQLSLHSRPPPPYVPPPNPRTRVS